MRSFFSKVMSLVTAGCLILTLAPLPAVSSIPDARRETVPIRAAAGDFELPYTAGRVTDARYFGSDAVVINIQDLHCHPEVQKNIARILGYLDARHALSRVYLEGAIGPVNTSLLGVADDDKFRRKITDALLEKGRLTGAEYYSLNSRKYDLIRGLEDGRLYKENALRLKSILDNREEILDALSELRENLQSLKKAYFGAKNRRLDRIVEKYRAGNYDGRRYFGFIIKTAENAGVDIHGYRNIVHYRRLMALEKDLNYRRITAELQRFMAVLKQTLPYADYNSLVERTGNFSRIDELYRHLAGLERSGAVATNGAFPNLSRFFTYIETSRSVNPLSLVAEEKKLLKEIQSRNAVSVPEREIVFLQDFCRILEDYANNRISAGDYEYYASNIDVFRDLLAKYTQDDALEQFEPYARVLDDYYRVNVDRNESFIKNTLGAGARGPESAVGENDAPKVLGSINNGGRAIVTVTGGFHTDGLAKLLRERKISYVVITPNVTGDTKPAETLYTRLISEQARILDQTLAALILAQYPFSETARRNAAAAFTALMREGIDTRDTAALKRILNDRVFAPMAKEYEKTTGKTLETLEIASVRYDETDKRYLFVLDIDGTQITFDQDGALVEGKTPSHPLLGTRETESLIARWFGEDALNDALDVLGQIRNETSIAAYSLESFLNWKRLDGRVLDRRTGELRLKEALAPGASGERSGYAFQADVDKLRDMNQYLGKGNVDFLIARYLDVMHEAASRYGGFAVRWGGDEAMGFIPGKRSSLRSKAIFDAMRERVIDIFKERYAVAVLPDTLTREQIRDLKDCSDVVSFDEDRFFLLFEVSDHDPEGTLARVRKASGITGLKLHDFNGGWLFYPTVSVGAVDISAIPEAKDDTIDTQRFVEIVSEYAARAVHRAKAKGRNRMICRVIKASGHETGVSTLADAVDPDIAAALRDMPLREVPREQTVRQEADGLLFEGEQMTVLRLLPSYKGEGLRDIPSSKGNGWLRFKSINDSDLFSYKGGDDTIRLNYVCAQIDLEEKLKKLVGKARVARGTTDDLVIVFNGSIDDPLLMELVDSLTARINRNSKIRTTFDVVSVRSEKSDTYTGAIFKKADRIARIIQPPTGEVFGIVEPKLSGAPGSENRIFTYDPAQLHYINQAIRSLNESEGRQAEQTLAALRSAQQLGSGGRENAPEAPAGASLITEEMTRDQVHVITDNLASRILTGPGGRRYVEPGVELKIKEHHDYHLRYITQNRWNIAYATEFSRSLAAILRELDGAAQDYYAEALRAYCLELLRALMRESFIEFARNPEAAEQLVDFYAGIVENINDTSFFEGLVDDASVHLFRGIMELRVEDLDALESREYIPVYLAFVRIMNRAKRTPFFAKMGKNLSLLEQSIESGDMPGDRDMQLDVIDFLIAENTSLFGGLPWIRRTVRKALRGVSALHATALVSGKPVAAAAEKAAKEESGTFMNAPDLDGIPFIAVREGLDNKDIADLTAIGEKGIRCPVAFTVAAEDEYLPDGSFLFNVAVPAESGQGVVRAGTYLEKILRKGVTVYVVKLDYRQGASGDRKYVLGRGTNSFLKQLFEDPVAMRKMGIEGNKAAGAIIDTGDSVVTAHYANPRSFSDALSEGLSKSAIVIVSRAGDGSAAARKNADIILHGTESPAKILADCGRKMINKAAEAAVMRGGSNLNIRFDVTQLRSRPDREGADTGTGKLAYVKAFFDVLKTIRGGNIYVQMGKVYDPADPRKINKAIIEIKDSDPEGSRQLEETINYIHGNGGKAALDYIIPAGADLALYRAAIVSWVRGFGIDTAVIDLSGRSDIAAVEAWYIALCEEVRLARTETELPLLLAPRFESVAARLSERTGQKRVMLWEGDSEAVPARMTGEKVFLKITPRQDSEAVWENISGAVNKAPVADVSIPVPGEVFSGDRFKPEGENPFTLAQVSEFFYTMVTRIMEPYAKGYATAMQYDKKHLPVIDREITSLFEARDITLPDGTKLSAPAVYAPLALYRHAQAAGNEEILRSGQCLELALAAAKLLSGTGGRIVEDKAASFLQAAERSSGETVMALTRELAGYWEGILGRVLTEQYLDTHGSLPFADQSRRETFARFLVNAAGAIDGDAVKGADSETLDLLDALGFKTAQARPVKEPVTRFTAAQALEELKNTVPSAGDQSSLERYIAQVNMLITVMKEEGSTAPEISAAVEPFLPPLMEAMDNGRLTRPGAIAGALRVLDILNDREKGLTAERIEGAVIKNLDKTIRGTARIRAAA